MGGQADEAARWLTAATEDLAYARHAAAGGFHAPACFLAQQAAEKAVKAVHYSGGARVVTTFVA
jgi:HEPN domain-containing protein